MVTDDPAGKPSADSKLYAFPLKIAIGGRKFPPGFLQAKIRINKLSFSTEVLEYTALLLLSANTSFVGFYWSSAKVISILCQFWFVHYTKFHHSSSL